MITLFTTPKDFTGIFKVIQTNALNSWRVISHDIQIIIMGNSDGSKDVAKLITRSKKYILEIRDMEYAVQFKMAKEGFRNVTSAFKVS